MINCLVEIIFFCVSLIMPTSENCEPKIGTNFNNTRKQLTNSSVVSDIYEDNDEISKAYRIDEENYFLYDNREIEISANLHYEIGILDVDYYSFTLTRDSQVKITLETSTTFTYVFSVLETSYVNSNNNSLLHHNFPVFNDETNDNIKIFNEFLKGGTYFIQIEFTDDVPDLTTMTYNFNVEITSKNVSNNIDLGDLIYNKRLKGAVWVNDLLPFTTLDFLNFNKSIAYYNSNGTALTTVINEFDDIAEFVTDGTIKVAEVYIRDPELKAALYEFINFLLQETLEKIEYDELVGEQITYILDKTEKTLSLFLTAASFFIDIPPFVDVLLDIIFSLTENICLELTMPYSTYEVATFVGFLSALKASLFVPDINGTQTIQYNYYEEVNQVFVLPIYASIHHEYDLLGHKTSYFSLRPTFLNFNNLDYQSLVKDIDEILIKQENSGFEYGDLFLFSLNNNSKLAFESQIIIEELQDVPATSSSVYLNTNYSFKINHGNYFWYDFTSSSTKKYYFKAYGQYGENVVISLHTTLENGYETNFMIESKNGGYANKDDASLTGCYFSYTLYENQTIYIRISGLFFEEITGIINFEIEDEFPEELIHTHDYTHLYTWFNGSQHCSYCECGSHIKEGHVVSQGIIPFAKLNKICIKCGGQIELGFVILSNSKAIIFDVIGKTNNNSYITSNNIILLASSDYINFANNNLQFIYFERQNVTINVV